MRVFCLCLFMLSVACPPLLAQNNNPVRPAVVQSGVSQPIGFNTEFFVAPNDSMHAAEALGQAFSPGQAPVLNFGASRNVVFVRFSITNASPGNPFIEVQNPLLEEIALYELRPDGPLELFSGGVSKKFSERPVVSESWVIPVDVPQGGTRTYLLRARTGFAFHLPVMVHAAGAYAQSKQNNLIFWGVYFGIMLFAFIYNLFIYITVRDRYYAYYLIYIALTAVFYLGLEGYSFEFFWPNTPRMNFYLHTIDALVNIAVVAFSLRFLQVKAFSRVAYGIGAGFIGLFVVIIFIDVFVSFALGGELDQLGSLLMALYVIYLGIHAMLKGVRTARFFLLAWSLFMVLTFVFIFTLNGLIPANFFTTHALFIGNMSEVILLSFALADRINLLKKQNEEKQAQIINQLQVNQELQEKVNRELEQKVAERTAEIQRKSEALMELNEEITQQKEEILTQRDSLEEANRELGKKNDDITASINYARRIQQAILPPLEELAQHAADSFVFYQPRDIVSGDYYWTSYLKEQQLLVVSVMDCTGHGVPGAFMSMIGHTILSNVVNERGITHPTAILQEANHQLYTLLRSGDSHQADSMEGMVAVIDYPAKTLRLAGAKGEAMLLKGGEFTRIRGTLYNLGAADSPPTFAVHEIALDGPIQLYMYSDGYQDQFGGTENTKFMGKNLRRLIREASAADNMEAQGQQLEEAFQRWKGAHAQTDDVTVLGIKL